MAAASSASPAWPFNVVVDVVAYSLVNPHRDGRSGPASPRRGRIGASKGGDGDEGNTTTSLKPNARGWCLAWLLSLRLVSSAWRRAIDGSSGLPAIIATHVLGLRLSNTTTMTTARTRRRVPDDLPSMGWGELKRQWEQARSLQPLDPCELLPIEACDRTCLDCPIYCEALDGAEGPHGPAARWWESTKRSKKGIGADHDEPSTTAAAVQVDGSTDEDGDDERPEQPRRHRRCLYCRACDNLVPIRSRRSRRRDALMMAASSSKRDRDNGDGARVAHEGNVEGAAAQPTTAPYAVLRRETRRERRWAAAVAVSGTDDSSSSNSHDDTDGGMAGDTSSNIRPPPQSPLQTTHHLRRDPGAVTYGTVVFDVDGVSAKRLLRQMRQLCVESGGRDWRGPEACSMHVTPSFRYMGGSCAHQYELYPVTLTSDTQQGDRFNLPPDFCASLERRDVDLQRVFYVAFTSADGPAAVPQAAVNMVRLFAAMKQPGCTYDSSKLIVPEDAAQGDGDVLNTSPAAAYAICERLESGCGSESDFGGATPTSRDSSDLASE